MTQRLTNVAIRVSQGVVFCVALFVIMSLAYPESRKALGGEFPEYYIAGQMFLRGEPVYDHELHTAHYREMTDTNRSLPFVSGPFLLFIFAPLSLLPFPAAYSVWLVLSAILFATGILLLAPMGRTQAGLWLGFAFPTALIDTFMVGQIPTIAFCSVAAAVALERQHRNFWSGAVLAICLYKPSLLLWLVPFLFITQRWKAIAGFGSSALALAAVSAVTAGRDLCAAWVALLITWTGNVTTTVVYQFPTWKYVDLNAFRKLVLPPGRASLAGTIALTAMLVIGLFLVWLRADADLAWAASITATLVVNIYTPIYDCILVVAAVMLVSRRLRPAELFAIGFTLTACGWLAIPIGDVHTPPMSVTLCLLLAFEIALSFRRHDPAQCIETTAVERV